MSSFSNDLTAACLPMQASVPSMVAFFCMALLGALSVISSYLAAIYARALRPSTLLLPSCRPTDGCREAVAL